MQTNNYPSSNGIPDPKGGGPVGVSITGGGNRTLTAGMGQLRGLAALGKLKREFISHLSSVSGSTMLSLVYAYRDASISDEQLLGPAVANPGELSWFGGANAVNLGYLGLESVGRTGQRLATEKILSTLIELHMLYGFPFSELYGRAIGKLVFEPYGLNKVNDKGLPLKYIGYTKEWLETRVVDPELSAEDFYLVPDDSRLYTVFNSSLFPDEKKSGQDLVPFELSPSYTGVFPVLPDSGPGGAGTGGGYIESYAMGSTEPRESGATDKTQVQTPKTRIGPGDVTGLSGAASAAILIDNVAAKVNEKSWFRDLSRLARELENFPPTKSHLEQDDPELYKHLLALGQGDIPAREFVPNYPYWPVMDIKSGARDSFFADGGQLENTGVAALLRRGITRVISFLNFAVPLGYDAVTDSVIVEESLPPLFGYVPYEKGKSYKPYKDLSPEEFEQLSSEHKIFSGIQVFPEDKFLPLMDAFREKNLIRKGSAIHKQVMKTVENKRMGVEGGRETQVLWVYGTFVEKWNNQLPWSVRLMMKIKAMDYTDFPNLATTKMHLNPHQVNLMAHMSCWNVLENRELFESMWE